MDLTCLPDFVSSCALVAEAWVDGLPVDIRVSSIDQIRPLRHAVLRTGLALETAIFPGDDDPQTLHLGGYDGDVNVACCSFMLNTYEGAPAWQLRGMAVAPGLTGRGLGAQLLSYAEAILLRESDVRQLWCNARLPAVGFYQRQGWVVVSEEFDVPTAGPHHRMAKQLA